ncbi:glycosyltransferase family 4 protein [Geomonas edaphica]|uniref:glycosyltransferase family 4 protein n=1 Tax=Geomonas edaphica TaxID=2570226 RepID=UPI0010A7AAB3|nr:glycosyltransferase family 4 protein [Geomonas edaphica]
MQRIKILVGEWCDEHSNNAQTLNTKELLSRFNDSRMQWYVPYYKAPDRRLLNKQNVVPFRMTRKRTYSFYKTLYYTLKADALFYPNLSGFQLQLLRLRKLFGKRVPVIATLEGLNGDVARQNLLSEHFGHPVVCAMAPRKRLRRSDFVFKEADQIIAISDFLGQVAERLFGPKVSVLPLGIDAAKFGGARNPGKQFTVISAGTVYQRKRPEVFLELGAKFRSVNFVWYGDGQMRQGLVEQAKKLGLDNVHFPGPIANAKLAEKLKEANLFVLPSLSEGVPKVAQEASACGLPVIIFGHYESPTVIDGHNGHVVWDQQELCDRIADLVANPEKVRVMGDNGVTMSKTWNWDDIAPRWERRLFEVFQDALGRG